ncbi:MAG: hypothetical protein GPJ54_02480 [Candidatus Heimdallarchaeota archaeon]|nr:hypothetical protein [Candidatus Heimdallarchaeota archaeon]
MTSEYKCENCKQTYPDKIPKFCVKCGNKLQIEEISQPSKSVKKNEAPVAEKSQSKPSTGQKVYRCENCKHEYPDKIPKFCIKCGNKLQDHKFSQPPGLLNNVEETAVEKIEPKTSTQKDILKPSTREVPLNVSSQRIRPNRLRTKSRDFRVAKNDSIFVILLLSIFLSSFEDLFIPGLVGIFIAILIYSGSSLKLPYIKSDKSSTPINIAIITILVTILQIFNYFFFWLANIILYTLVFYFSPPKEIIKSHLENKTPNYLLISGGAFYVFFMFADIPWLGALISVIFAMQYLYKIHSILLLTDISTPSQSYQSTPAQSYAVDRIIVQGIEPIINSQGTVPELNKQLNQMFTHVRYQVDNFNLNLQRLNEQYDDLTKIIEEDLNNQLTNLNDKLESDDINSRAAENLLRGVTALRSQVLRFESERDLLLRTYSEEYETNIVSSLEELLRMAKDNHGKIRENIASSEIFVIENNLARLDKLESELQLINQKLIEREGALRQEFLDQQSAIERERKEKVEVKSFKLQTLISEKVVSNLFAYVGAAFIIAGFLFLLNFTYENYILKNFPETAPFDDARFGIGVLYMLSIIIIAVPSWVLNKIGVKFKIISPIFMSIGILFLQLTLYVQAFYFVSLELENETFAIIGTLVVIAAFSISYLWKSQLVGFVATEMGIWLYYTSSLNNLISKYFVTLGFFGLLLISYWLVYRRGLWIPFATLSFFTPVLWMVIYQNINNIWLPEYLTLCVTVLNVLIALQRKMPTPKPFSNFLTTTSLIYPNFIALQFTVLLPSDEHIKSLHGTSSIIIVLTSFFVLYWLYVLFEGEITLDFSLPVSYKFREEQLKYQRIEQKLNWLMLTSLLILLIAGLSLIDKGIYQPIIFFAAFLAIMSNVAQIKNFEKFVKNSSILFIFESQLFFVFNLFNPEAPNLIIAALTGIFLISFTVNFQLILKYQSEFNFQGIKLDTKSMGTAIALSSVVNYVISSFSEFESIVLLVAVSQWLFIIHTMLLMENKTQDTRHFIHIASISAPIALFIGGLLKSVDGSRFDQSTSLERILVNLPLILIFTYVIYLSFKGDLLSIPKQDKVVSNIRHPWYRSFINIEKIYAPQLLLFILPNILIIYGKPYFFFLDNQALLILYMLLYFLLLPILFLISEKKEEKSFSILSSFWGYFSFLLAFIILGGAKQVYDKIINPAPSDTKPSYLIPLEWAIFLFVIIFVGSITWTLSLSKRFDSMQIKGSIEQNLKSQATGDKPNTLEV